MKKSMNKMRIKYLMGFLVLLITETLIALYIHDDFIRPYIGDVLVVMVLYCFVRIFIPNSVKMMPLYVLGTSDCAKNKYLRIYIALNI